MEMIDVYTDALKRTPSKAYSDVAISYKRAVKFLLNWSIV
jgi:hypothetical protein